MDKKMLHSFSPKKRPVVRVQTLDHTAFSHYQRKTLLRIIAMAGLMLLALFVFISYAQARVPVKKETCFSVPVYQDLIIQVPQMNEKNKATLKTNIMAAGGLVFRGYCDKMQLIMFSVDRTVHADDRFLETIMPSMSLEYFIKTDATIDNVNLACGNPVTPF